MVPSPTTITSEDMMSLALTGTEGLPSHTNVGPPKKAATAVVREKTLMALTAPLRGARYTTSKSELLLLEEDESLYGCVLLANEVTAIEGTSLLHLKDV